MMKLGLSALLLCSAIACNVKTSDDEIAREDDTVSGAEMPAGRPLALDSLHNFRVVEHGIQFEDGYYYIQDSTGQRWVPSSHKYSPNDTAFFTPVVKGLGVVDGKVSVSPGFTIRNSRGIVIYESRATKHVSRFPEEEARFATFRMPVAWLDSLAGSHATSHYDVEYTLKDRISGKGIDGIYRVHVARD